MKHIVTILFLTTPLMLFGQKDSVDIWLSRIDNASIVGTCHYAWVIEPSVKEVRQLIRSGKPIKKRLINLLTDENKGITVHYILSNIYQQTEYTTLDMDSVKVIYNYNGLEFIELSGRMQTDKLKLEKCKGEWIRKIGK